MARFSMITSISCRLFDSVIKQGNSLCKFWPGWPEILTDTPLLQTHAEVNKIEKWITVFRGSVRDQQLWEPETKENYTRYSISQDWCRGTACFTAQAGTLRKVQKGLRILWDAGFQRGTESEYKTGVKKGRAPDAGLRLDLQFELLTWSNGQTAMCLLTSQGQHWKWISSSFNMTVGLQKQVLS